MGLPAQRSSKVVQFGARSVVDRGFRHSLLPVVLDHRQGEHAHRLRSAVGNDAEVIAKWFPTYEDAVSWAGPDVPSEGVSEWLARLYADPTRRHFVLVDASERICGTTAVSLKTPGRMHVSQVAIAPSMRGRGLGRKLLDLVVEFAKTSDAPKLTLFVYEDNASARRLYEGCGFVIAANDNVKTGPYGAMLSMELLLNEDHSIA